MSKKLLFISSILVFGSLPAIALAQGSVGINPVPLNSGGSGIYLGVEGGYGYINWDLLDNMELRDEQSLSYGKFSYSNSSALRGFLGYDINKFLAIEAGYTYFFHKADFKVDSTNCYAIRTTDIDIEGKLKIPVTTNFDIYTKLGTNYMESQAEGGGLSKIDNFNGNTFSPIFGLGAEYNITPSFILNVEWMYLGGNPKLIDYQPSVDAFMLGLRYKIPTSNAISFDTENDNNDSAIKNSGIYLGIAGGYGITNWRNLNGVGFGFSHHKDIDGFASFSPDDGAVGRIFFGYDFNKYFALETGYNDFFYKTTLRLDNTAYYKIQDDTFDIVGKFKLPIANKYAIYTKFGADYLVSHWQPLESFLETGHEMACNITYGAGIDYALTSHLIINAEWQRFYGRSSINSDYLPGPDTFMLGLRYKFSL